MDKEMKLPSNAGESAGGDWGTETGIPEPDVRAAL